MSGSMPLSRASLHAIRIFPIRFWPTKQPTVAYSPRRIRSCSRLIAALDKPRALSFFFKRVSRRLCSSLRVPHFVAVRPVWKMLSSIITASDGSDNSKRRKSSLPRHFLPDNVFHPFDVERLSVIAFFTLMGLADSLFRHESIVTSHQPTLDGNVRVRAS